MKLFRVLIDGFGLTPPGMHIFFSSGETPFLVTRITSISGRKICNLQKDWKIFAVTGIELDLRGEDTNDIYTLL